MSRQIVDLHGNKFEVKGYNIYLDILALERDSLIYTRDLISGVSFNLSKKKDRYKAYFYNQALDVYIGYKLSKIGYDESQDIRKSYLYGKKNK